MDPQTTNIWSFLLSSTAGFAVKALIIAVLAIIVLSFFAQALRGEGQKRKKKIEVEDWGKNLESYYLQVKKVVLGKKHFEQLLKSVKKKRKDRESKNIHGPAVFVIDFEGDIQASRVDLLRDEISTVLETADPKKDEVMVRVESRGGAVHGYGLAASQLQRVKDKKIKLTVSVDKVAASGGYMMACVADKIISAPFAIVGSIGVFAGVPNLHRLLKKHDVDYEEITAGEFKRTISLLGEISPKGRQKFIEQIEDIHKLFKEFVLANRPSLDISQTATGEYWYGLQAKGLNLVDEICSSDDYMARLLKDNKKVFKIKLSVKKSLADKINDRVGESSLASRFFNWNKRRRTPNEMIEPEIFPDYFM